MAIYYSTDNLPEFNNAVVTIGTFDGVHVGHQVILDQVSTHARKHGATSVLITFSPHPRKLIFPNEPISILTPLKDKLKLITEIGIEHIVVVPFTKDFASLSAEEYVSDFLVNKINPKTIIIGYDHHFGNDRKGNIQLLNSLKTKYNFEVIEIEAQLIEDATISSTKIRDAVATGDITTTNDMLGRPYSISGKVIKGNQIGRTINYPTANILLNEREQIIPANGVYAIRAVHKNKVYNGMLNIGYRPTVSNNNKLYIEAHLFDFEQDIYDDELSIDFIQRVRDEQKFSDVNALKEQLSRDKETCEEILS